MNLPPIDLLVDALLAPTRLTQLDAAEWDLLIRQGRNADLLARIACTAHALLEQIPVSPRRHLEAAAKLALRQRREVYWEVEQIVDALAPTGLPVVLLKGAAYAIADLPAAEGRMVSDVDILVPRQQLVAVESALMMKGWVSEAKSAYDQRYYRTWMHELPPMRHFRRGTVIDVHHAILPLSARWHPSSEKLLAAALPVEFNEFDKFDGRIMVLAPVDMLLHSATHLFQEGELAHGLRDLVDIDSLLRHFGTADAFWQALVPRAVELELSRPLFYALRYANLMLGTPLPESVVQAAVNAPGGRRPGAFLAFMDSLFLRALRPAHATTADRLTALARWQLYVRSHWLRMPPSLLIPHLARKALTISH
jgi:hypothetical protein